jgi:hypothetical protein
MGGRFLWAAVVFSPVYPVMVVGNIYLAAEKTMAANCDPCYRRNVYPIRKTNAVADRYFRLEVLRPIRSHGFEPEIAFCVNVAAK